MMREFAVPVIDVDGEPWLLLKHLDSKIVFRAYSIEKPRRVAEPNQHRVFESVAEGGVKCKPKRWDLAKL
ncbi:hypothetical protein HYS54_02565 [Candidatus Micrarchaeota archaeon]|nr:hypothetical protein [Candidatus Micrarchaeota archaeon]